MEKLQWKPIKMISLNQVAQEEKLRTLDFFVLGKRGVRDESAASMLVPKMAEPRYFQYWQIT